MTSDIPSLLFDGDSGPPEHVNIGLYSAPGQGKSCAAATAPGPILWVNGEGRNALAFPRKLAAERGTAIHAIHVDERSDVVGVLRGVLVHVRGGGDPRPQTVVLDTVGKLRDLLARRFVVLGSKDSMQQWQRVTVVLREFVQAMRDEPVNLVLLAHEARIESDDAPTVIEPGFGGVLSEQLTRELDILAYLARVPVEGEDDRFFGQFVEARSRRAKDRSGGALGRTRPVDLTDWFSTFRAALTPDDSDLPFKLSTPLLDHVEGPAPEVVGGSPSAVSDPAPETVPEPDWPEADVEPDWDSEPPDELGLPAELPTLEESQPVGRGPGGEALR